MDDTDRSVDVDQPTNPPPEHQTADAPEPQICCDCGHITREPVKVGEAFSSSGAGRDVFACPQHAPSYPVGGVS